MSRKPQPRLKTRVRTSDRFLSLFRRGKKPAKAKDADISGIDTTSASSKELPSDQVVSDGNDAALKIFWPRDLLGMEESFSEIRVLTYGYESSPKSPFQGNLNTMSRQLLSELSNERLGAVGLLQKFYHGYC